jgi:hypothetical protein
MIVQTLPDLRHTWLTTVIQEHEPVSSTNKTTVEDGEAILGRFLHVSPSLITSINVHLRLTEYMYYTKT